ncbi:hypothetical protein CRG98_002961 [Punica granatum]|uniref:Uncharacterized protein n=1 Tax=Punica granatum TaxID=22663 RepID=A0A2I0L7I1_PUNGR|nr:hypothetical protein CRG98_002961 [Punica granatum]
MGRVAQPSYLCLSNVGGYVRVIGGDGWSEVNWLEGCTRWWLQLEKTSDCKGKGRMLVAAIGATNARIEGPQIWSPSIQELAGINSRGSSPWHLMIQDAHIWWAIVPDGSSILKTLFSVFNTDYIIFGLAHRPHLRVKIYECINFRLSLIFNPCWKQQEQIEQERAESVVFGWLGYDFGYKNINFNFS